MKIICFVLWTYLIGASYAGFIGQTQLEELTAHAASPHTIALSSSGADGAAGLAGADDGESAQYEFQYSVHDGHTGDVKDQFEHRRGNYVTGRYSLLDADGLQRVVEYSADPLLGFTAEVRRELPKLTIAPIEHAPSAAAAAQEAEAGEWQQ